MSFAGFPSAVIDKPRGPIIRTDVSDIPVGLSLLSLNAEYNMGQVQKRLGFSQAGNPVDAFLNGMYNWVKGGDSISPGGSLLLYLSNRVPTTFKLRYIPNLSAPVAFDLLIWPSAASGIVFANSGARLVVVTYNGGPQGPTSANQAYIVSEITGPTLVADTAFPPPLNTLPSFGGLAAGPGSAGYHRAGYVITYRSGFTGKISPVSGTGVFNTNSSFTVPANWSRLMTVTATWPAGAVSVQAVMTPANNPNRYFLVPFQSFPVVAGALSTVNFALSISDDDLLAEATDISANYNLLTQDVQLLGPHFVFAYGKRMGYIVDVSIANQGIVSTCFFSEPENHQNITADQHGITLPGFAKMNCAFIVRNVAYLLGPDWTYAVQDTGDVPVLWPDAVLVDGEIGCVSALGTTVNASGGFAWVVSKRGLEMFSAGQYGRLPMSYYVEDDWKRINFSQVGASWIKVVDNEDRQRVMIQVCLDGASTPTHIMVFSYEFGLTPEAMAQGYSLWDISSFDLGSFALVQNPSTNLVEPWVASRTAGTIMRQNRSTDANPQRDLGQPVGFLWESGILPPITKEPGRMWTAQGLIIRATGPEESILRSSVYAMDRIRLAPPIRDIILSGAPGQEFMRRIKNGFNSEGFTVRLEENTLDGGASISLIAFYYSPFAGWNKNA